jgi:hypothetical protein
LIVIRDRPALWWLLALMFIGVGAGFVYLGVARAFEVPWWQASLFAGMGIAAVGTGVHVAWGSPLSTIVVDRDKQELRLVQTGIFGRRVRRFRFRDIDKVVVERRRDDDGAMMARPALELKDGQSVSLSALWRHDTAGMTRVIKMLRPSVVARPGEEEPEDTGEEEATEVTEATGMAETKEATEAPKVVGAAEVVQPVVAESHEVVPSTQPELRAKPAWYEEEPEPTTLAEVAEPVDEIDTVADFPEPVAPVSAVETIDPFEPPDPLEVVERVEVAEPVHTFMSVEIADPFAPVEREGPIALAAPAEPIEALAPVAPVDLIEPVEFVEPVADPAPVSGAWAAAANDVEPERFSEPIDVNKPSDAIVAYAAGREAGGLQLVEAAGLRLVEGSPFRPFLRRARDAGWIVEACLSNRARCALLYAVNVTPGFFDLSSGEAGEILQKLRNYRVRLAVVRPPDSPPMSSRFGEMLAEEGRGPHFGVFDTRAEAEAWLRRVEP